MKTLRKRRRIGVILATHTALAQWTLFDQDIDADLGADLDAALRESMETTSPLWTLLCKQL
jgi:hypothetical protein